LKIENGKVRIEKAKLKIENGKVRSERERD
jgi:hypothetical protein